MEKEFYLVKDIKEIIGCGLSVAYELMNSRNFPKIKIGKRYYVPKEEFEKWVERNTKSN